jgi:simple sugar transport system substrate-binding protein
MTMAVTAGCQNNKNGAGVGKTYHYITHANPSDAFWVTLQQGMDDAAKVYNATATFYGTGNDVNQQNMLVDAAVAAHVDGIAVTFTNISQQYTHIAAAVNAGIPVIAINVGYRDATEEAMYPTGISAYVGQVEPVASADAVAYAAKRVGIKRALCVQGAITQGWAVQRCEGFKTALGALGFTEQTDPSVALADNQYTVLKGDFYANPPVYPGSGGGAGATTMNNWFAANGSTVDFVLSTAPAPLSQIVTQSSTLKAGSVVGSFDIDAGTIAAIHEGTCSFTVDQQQYLQGYLPITILELEIKYLLKPASSQTGPFFVDATNINQIEALVNQGIR